MDIRVEKRRAFLINFAYFSLFIVLYYCFVKYALGYVFPFLFAAVLAISLQKPIRYICGKLKFKKHSLVSAVLVTLICLVLIFIIILAGIFLVSELKGFFQYLSSKLSNLPAYINEIEGWLLSQISRLPDSLRTPLYQSVTDFFKENMSFDGVTAGSFDPSILLTPLQGAWSTAKRIPSILLAILVTIISCFFTAVGYNKIKDGFLGLFNFETQKRILDVKRSFFGAISRMAKAYLLIMFITFMEIFLGLNLLKLIGVYEGSYIFVIALVTAIVDIIPVFGTGAIIIPWALACFFTGNVGLGIGLLILYAAISVIRQIIEPKLVAGQVGLPAIITIMAMFIGAKVFGVFGIIILPLSVIALKLMYDEGIFANRKT